MELLLLLLLLLLPIMVSVLLGNLTLGAKSGHAMGAVWANVGSATTQALTGLTVSGMFLAGCIYLDLRQNGSPRTTVALMDCILVTTSCAAAALFSPSAVRHVAVAVVRCQKLCVQ
jgi:hypothetical protein